MLASSLLTTRARHHVALGVLVATALVAPAAAAQAPPDLPPVGTPVPGGGPAPGAAPGQPAQPAPPTPAPRAKAPQAPPPPYGSTPPPAGMPPGVPWMSPSEVPPGYSLPMPRYYPMPYVQQVPRQENNYTLPPPPPRRRADSGLFVGGILAVSGGLAAVITGAALVSSASNRIDIYCDSPSFPCAHKDDAPRKTGGVLLMTAGALAGAAGIPMWIIGSKLVPIPKDEKAPQKPALRPEVRVGFGTARLSFEF